MKRLTKLLAVCALALSCSLLTTTGFAATATAENSAVKSEGAAGAADTATDEQAIDYYKNAGFLYTSKRYGYSIICPSKPKGVIPVSMLGEDGNKGDVLIFDNEGYDLKNAWLVMVDAFTDEELPGNLAKKSEAEQQAFIDNLMNTAGYEFVRLFDFNGKLGIYAVPAKEIEVDTDGDGKPDETMISDTRMIRTFFRGQFGGHFSIQLIDNPELTEKNVTLYRLGILTFQEWPTVVDENGVAMSREEAAKAERKAAQAETKGKEKAEKKGRKK